MAHVTRLRLQGCPQEPPGRPTGQRPDRDTNQAAKGPPRAQDGHSGAMTAMLAHAAATGA